MVPVARSSAEDRKAEVRGHGFVGSDTTPRQHPTVTRLFDSFSSLTIFILLLRISEEIDSTKREDLPLESSAPA